MLKPDVTQEHVYLATAKNIVKGKIVGNGNRENINFIHLLVKRRAWKFRIWLESYYSYIADFPVKKTIVNQQKPCNKKKWYPNYESAKENLYETK